MKNPFGKKADIENPYAIYMAGDLEYRVLKTYKQAKNEDGYSRWLVAGKSGATFGSWEYGDMHCGQIKTLPLVDCTEEWREIYDPSYKAKEMLRKAIADTFGEEILTSGKVEVI